MSIYSLTNRTDDGDYVDNPHDKLSDHANEKYHDERQHYEPETKPYTSI